MLSQLRRADARIRTGLSRWWSSKAPDADLAARFIDLRIALEALFLAQSNAHEYGFRIAASGAWLLGRDGPDRKSTWKTLRDAYSTASRAVHTGTVDRTDDHLHLLGDAQALCRRALFRFLRNGPIRSWPDVFLDVTAPPARPADVDDD